MKVWACIELRERGALGLPSRAGERLGERTVLAQTVARARRTAGLEGVAVLVSPGGAGAALEILGSEARVENVRVLEVLEPDFPRREALQRARKWSKDGWRLGIGQTVEADAAGHFPSLAAAGRELGADAVISVLPEAALVGPELLAGLVEHAAPADQPPLPSAGCQAPGGFAGLFGMVGWLEAMGANDLTCGQNSAWRPDRPSQVFAIAGVVVVTRWPRCTAPRTGSPRWPSAAACSAGRPTPAAACSSSPSCCAARRDRRAWAPGPRRPRAS